MTQLLNLSTAKLKRIIALKQKIERLSTRLAALAGESAAPAGTAGRKRWTMSLAARRKIAAAQRARWAKAKGRTAKPAKKKRSMSAAGRARIAAAQKARWAKIKAAKNK